MKTKVLYIIYIISIINTNKQKGDKMNYENWTNGNLTTYNNKRVSRGIIKNISYRVGQLFKKRKMLSNHYFVRMNMGNDFRKDLNSMKVGN